MEVTTAPPPPAAEVVVSPSTSGSMDKLWAEARALFLAALSTSQQQKEALRDTTATLDNTITSLKTAQERASNSFGVKFKGTPIEFNLGRALRRLQLILALGDSAMDFAPESASYVWAAFRMILRGVTANLETCEFIAGAIDRMSDAVFICQVYARRQMKRLGNAALLSPGAAEGEAGEDETKLLAHRVLEKIPILLALVLKFSYETRRLLVDKGRISRMMSILLGRSEELKSIVKDAQEQSDELHRLVDAAFQDAAADVLEAVHVDTRGLRDLVQESSDEILRAVRDAATKNNEQLAPAIKAIQNEQDRKRELQDLEADWNNQLSWLRSGRPAERQLMEEMLRDNLRSRHVGTCGWIFETDELKTWSATEDDQGTHNISNNKRLLRITGEAGFGKSVLMSSVIEWLQSRETEEEESGEDQQGRQQKRQPIVLMFFCKTGDDSLQNGNQIMLSLLLQLFEWAGANDVDHPLGNNKADENRVREWINCRRACTDLIMKARNESKDGNTITFQDFQVKSGMAPLLSSLARRIGESGVAGGGESRRQSVYIVVDALDECADRGDGFIEALIQVAETAGVHVRVIVSSRPYKDIQTAFQNYAPACIELSKATNAKDVNAYVGASLSLVRRFSAQQRKTALKTIAKRANGMFRYANLAVESLKKTAALNVRAEDVINDLPAGLSGLYYQQLQALDEQTRQVLLVALRWAICGEGKISAEVVADELENTYFLADVEYAIDCKRTTDSESDDTVSDMTNENDSSTTSGSESGSEEQGEEEDQKVEEEEEDKDIERDAIVRLKAVDRNFLSFDEQNNLSLQHKSVQDYMESLETSLDDEEGEKMCRRCQERYGSALAISSSGQRCGHLDMALYCIRMLNSSSFRRKFLVESERNWVSMDEMRERQDARNAEPKPAVDERRVITRSGITARSADESQVMGTISRILGGSRRKGPMPDTASLHTDATLERPKANIAGGQPSSTSDALRYELTHWHYHVREAERHRSTSAAADRKLSDDKWSRLYTQINELFADKDVLDTWQRLIAPQETVVKAPDTPVHVAARFGIIQYLRRYVEDEKSDVNLQNENGSTLLHLACLDTGGFLGLKLLVERGASVNIFESDAVGGGTPFHNLVRSSGDPDLVRYMLAHGADPTLATRDKEGVTPLHIAVLARNLKVVQVLLEFNEETRPRVDVNAPDNAGETALHGLFKWPAAPEKLLRLLLDHGADVNVQDRDSQAPLYEATLTDNVAAARVLLERGADVDDLENVFGRTALFEAVDLKSAPMVRLLLEAGADPLLRDKALRNCLCIAVYRKDVGILGTLMDGVLARSRSAATPSSTSNEGGCESSFTTVVSAFTETDIRGETPMHVAASHGQVAMVAKILDVVNAAQELGKRGDGHVEASASLSSATAAAALVTARNAHGNTPLHSAAARGYARTVDILLRHGADVHSRNDDDNNHDTGASTALDLAITCWRTRGLLDNNNANNDNNANDDEDGCEYPNPYRVVKSLLENGATIIARNPDVARKLLDVAIETESVDVIRKVLSSSSSSKENERDEEGEKKTKKLQVAERVDSHGWTPLMLAIQTRKVDIVVLLRPFDSLGLMDRLEDGPLETSRGGDDGDADEELGRFVAGLPPTGWDVGMHVHHDTSTGSKGKEEIVSVSEDGLVVRRRNTCDGGRLLVRANHPIPFNASRFYFEITILEVQYSPCVVSIGVTNRYTKLDIHPGWPQGLGPSFGYHSDDGGAFSYRDGGENMKDRQGGPTYGPADTVGCGVDFERGVAFYTKNGGLIGDAPYPLEPGRWFPAVGLGDEELVVRANFGRDLEGSPFEYDPSTYYETRRSETEVGDDDDDDNEGDRTEMTAPANTAYGGFSHEQFSENSGSSCVVM